MKVNIPIDLRGHEVRAFETRLSLDGEKLRGYAAVFNQTSQDLGGYIERIAPGAFAESLRDNPDVRALWQHDPAYVLGRTTSGTLAVSEDDTGLASIIEPPDTQWARDAVTSIKRGDVTQMSFAFGVGQDGDRWDKQDGVWLRTILKARLYEVSPVTFPAYLQTSIAARSIEIDVDEGPPPDTRGNKSSGNSRTLAHLRRRLTLAEKI